LVKNGLAVVKMDKFTKIAFHRSTVNKAIIISLTVGTVLNVINQGDYIFQMQWEKISAFKVLLTYLTPFCVSTYSTATALMIKTPLVYTYLGNCISRHTLQS